MQDFHADCIINLQVHSQGKPGKCAWICSLTTRESVRLLHARKFLGIVSREEAEWGAILFGLRQAQRLQQEKVELAGEFTGCLEDPRKLRRPELQSLKAQSEKIWSSFRLRKLGRTSPAEAEFLREELGKAFSRRSRSRE